MGRRLAWSVIVALALTVLATTDSEAASRAPLDTARVVIDGRSFGPEHGLVIDVNEVEVGRRRGDLASSTAADELYQPMGTTRTWYWGSSYVWNTEAQQIRYTGTAYAAANIYRDKRIVQVCFQYRRDGRRLTNWVCSKATSSGSRWSPGRVVSKTVWDTLNPWAPPTTFRFKTVRIDRNVY